MFKTFKECNIQLQKFDHLWNMCFTHKIETIFPFYWSRIHFWQSSILLVKNTFLTIPYTYLHMHKKEAVSSLPLIPILCLLCFALQRNCEISPSNACLIMVNIIMYITLWWNIELSPINLCLIPITYIMYKV